MYKLNADTLAIVARFGTGGKGAPPGNGVLLSPWDVDVGAMHDVYVTEQGPNLIECFFYPFGLD